MLMLHTTTVVICYHSAVHCINQHFSLTINDSSCWLHIREVHECQQ